MSESSDDEEDIEPTDDGSCAWCSCLDEYAMIVNNYIERGFAAVGYIVASWPYFSLGFTLLFLGLCCIGYMNVTVETELYNLWTPTDSPVFDEGQFVDYYWGDRDYGLLLMTAYAKEGQDTNILDETYIDEWHEIHLDLATKLPRKDYTYFGSDNGERSVTFAYFAENYSKPLDLINISAQSEEGLGPTRYGSDVIPLCRPISESPAEGQFQMPCYMATIMDCFTEGGYFFPWENYLVNTMLSTIIPLNMYTYGRDSYQGKMTIELGEILGPSCSGVTGAKWPPNFIYGGETRMDSSDDTSTLIGVKSFQIGAFTDSAVNIARKMKIVSGDCLYTATYGISCPDITDEERDSAQEFMDEWLLDVISFLESYAEELSNNDEKLLNLVFFTPRTTGDLLSEASSADMGLLAIAYVVMIIFASLSALNVSDLFLSRSEASFAGVLLVLFSVVASIGLGSFAAVPLSPNIVQVLPFIALGFGVDDMFVLLFSFKYRERLSVPEMMSETIRIAGSSVALTSLANFLGFLIGTTMVLPDVERFASFAAIVVLLNFISIMFGFTAVLSLVGRRMKNEYNDWSFLFCWATFTRANKLSSEKASSVSYSLFDPLFDWLTKTYTRVVMILIFVTLIVIGIYGCTQISRGLPLDDIVPSTSYAWAFLRIRSLYYSSYPLSLYSDADGADLRSIDWENKFSDWLDATEGDLLSIDNVYPDADVHSVWAWSFRDYLITKYSESLTGEYVLAESVSISSVLSDDVVYQAYMCQYDAHTYCTSVLRQYEYGSDLFNCLLINYELNNLQSDCAQWVSLIHMDATGADSAIAKQLYITSYDDDDVEGVSGLYLAPSSSDIAVYIAQDESGYIYQSACGKSECEWYITDASFNILYSGAATSASSGVLQPAQGGWMDIETGASVNINHVYYDASVSSLNNTRDDVFISSDYTPSNVFTFKYNYDMNTCAEWQIMRLLMSLTDAFVSISMSDARNESDVTCNSYLESSEMCLSVRDESDLGSIYCGTYETNANNNLWYLGHRTCDELYQIMSTPNGDNGDVASPDVFDNCNNATAWTGAGNAISFAYNYLTPCGDAGFGITNNGSAVCEAPQDSTTDISLQCNALTDCNDLRSCYNDYQRLFLSLGTSSRCDVIGNYEQGIADGDDEYELALLVYQCSFKYYTQLSDCCREAVNSAILALPQVRCSDIDNGFAFEEDLYESEFKAVCTATDTCQYNSDDNTCIEAYTGRVFDDCRRLITGEDIDADCSAQSLGLTKEMIRTGEQSLFYDCLTSTVGKAIPGTRGTRPYSGSDYCQSTFNTQSAMYSSCLYPVDSFYDVSQRKYDYSMCSSYDFNANNLSDICGDDAFMDSTQQLSCLISNIDLIDDGCCQLAITQIANESFSFTNECELDTYNLCGGSITSAGTAMVAASDCLDAIVSADSINISPKCVNAMLHCESTTDGWETTSLNATASMDCDIGCIGTQYRTCIADEYHTSIWGDINNTQCIALTCPEIVSEYDSYWPQLSVGSVYKIQGESQISTMLQSISNISCSLSDSNVWYARRACILNPYNSSEAVWRSPQVECKPFMSLWNNVFAHTSCDFITEYDSANMIDAIVWSVYDIEVNGGVTTSNDTHISLSQSLCSELLDNCAAFTYDSEFSISYFFDYCPMLSSDDAYALSSLYDDPISSLFSNISDRNLSHFADRHSTYISPLNGAEFIASYCSPSAPLSAWSEYGIPSSQCFSNLLWLFLLDPSGNGVIKRDSFYFSDSDWISSSDYSVSIVTTSNTVIVSGISDDEVAVEFITSLRSVLSLWKSTQLYVVPSGLIISLFSQYLNVSSYLVSNLIYVSIAIAVCGLIFLLNPVAVCVAILCNTAMVIEVYGFSHWLGLRVNAVFVLNIVVSVALTMEFTAHIGRAFVASFVTEKDRESGIALPFSDDGQIRMKKSLRQMFTPVSLGALTTLIGVSPIAGAQFPYFRMYYFTLYVMIVAFGWMNGVIFQPIILSFIAPKPFEAFQHRSIANNQNNKDSVHELLVKHQANQETNNDEENPINIEIKTELIKRKHTRNDSDAP